MRRVIVACDISVCLYHIFLHNTLHYTVITVCQDTADSLDNGDRIDAIIIDFSKAFDFVPPGRLLKKIANSGGGF